MIEREKKYGEMKREQEWLAPIGEHNYSKMRIVKGIKKILIFLKKTVN